MSRRVWSARAAKTRSTSGGASCINTTIRLYERRVKHPVSGGRPSHLTATPSGLILKSVLNPSAADRVFDALGDPTRRALVARLSRGPMSVSELRRPFGITLAAVVQHVQV